MTKTAILLAGGKSTRFDSKNLKTLYKVKGVSLTEIVIRKIIDFEIFDEIVLVYNVEQEAEFKLIAQKFEIKIKLAPNGKTRFDSALNGAKIATSDCLVFVDVAAPFFERFHLQSIVEKIQNFDGVVSANLNLRNDYARLNSDGTISNIVKREMILQLKPFQAVKRHIWLPLALQAVNHNYTEMIKLLVDNNQKIGYIILEKEKWKITTKKDLKLLLDEGWLTKEEFEKINFCDLN